LLSGQVGVRTVQSDFDGNEFSTETRDQLFVTAGVYRRVDYGLQAGVVADILQEEWIAETNVSQLRADIAWVYPAGTAIGFRFARPNETDTTNGTVGGANFQNLFTETIENYRFYWRYDNKSDGFADIFAGWTNDEHAILGVDVDRAIGQFFAVQTGFTYYLPDDAPLPSQNDAWNVYMGFAYRPWGRAIYRNYDRPLFPVADNGSLVLRRGN
jgi:hypothetical protein